MRKKSSLEPQPARMMQTTINKNIGMLCNTRLEESPQSKNASRQTNQLIFLENQHISILSKTCLFQFIVGLPSPCLLRELCFHFGGMKTVVELL